MAGVLFALYDAGAYRFFLEALQEMSWNWRK
jgi:hypothetical protein